MTFAQIVTRLDTIVQALSDAERALRDGQVERAATLFFNVEALVVDLRTKLTQQTAESN